MRVLLIEDEPGISRFIKKGLEEENYTVDIADNGEDGLHMGVTESYDLIVLDVMLPKIDGYKVCRMLKFDEKYNKIPIILFSARAQEQDKLLGMQVGANGYIAKPFEPKVLLSKIEELINK